MKDGSLGHKEFLADGHSDPREAFVSSLVEALGTAGSIVVYSSYEQTRIDALARAYPGSATQLQAIKPRLFDLHAAVRQYCYHPDFHGSFSIKSVLPALVPDLGYDDLEIRDGGQAMLRFGEMIRPETTGERRLQIRRDLLAYCERDTLAMVRLVEVLKGGKLPQPQGV
jgi:predicted RecB family nuclease